MLLRRYLTIIYILLSLCPVLVMPQLYIKVPLCMAFAGYFVYQGCAESVNIVCRLIALQMKIVNCRFYPCVNYGSSHNNLCADVPTGCPFEYVKMFGLCPVFKICCGTGGVSIDEMRGRQSFQRLGLGKILERTSMTKEWDEISYNPFITAKSWNDTLGAGGLDFKQLSPELNLPEDPKDYMRDWPKNTTDPKIIEKAFLVQYDKFIMRIAAINKQEIANGMEPLKVISFNDFRAVGLGEKGLNEI